MKKLELYKEVEDYFQMLIEETGTYFLSDYVKSELEDYVTPKRYGTYLSILNDLTDKCKEKGLDIHDISQRVASIWLLGEGNEDKNPDIHIKKQFLLEQLANIGFGKLKLQSKNLNDVYVCKDVSSDRNIFIEVDKECEVIGMNYHQGIDEVDLSFVNPCEFITEIFNRIRLRYVGEIDKAILKAIELYNISFVDYEIFLDGEFNKGTKIK